IQEWPGNPIVESDGDHLLMAQQLAPYHDENGDGVYDPDDCDYPQIKCDQALFFVFNDKGGMHNTSLMLPVGMEIRAMAYACECSQQNEVLNDAIFLDYELINRGTNSLAQTFTSIFSDTDVLSANNDYVGTDVREGYTYFYDGDPLDAPSPNG